MKDINSTGLLLSEQWNRILLNEISFDAWARQKQNKDLLLKRGYADENGPHIRDIQALDREFDPAYSINNEQEVGNPNYLNWILSNEEELRSLGVTDNFCAGGQGQQWGRKLLNSFLENGKDIASFEARKASKGGDRDDLVEDLPYTANFAQYSPKQMKRLLTPILDDLAGGTMMKKYGKLKRHYSDEELQAMEDRYNARQDELEAQAREEGREDFQRGTFKAPKNTPFEEADYQIVYEDPEPDGWIIYLPISHQGDPKRKGISQDLHGEQFIGQKARTEDVYKHFGYLKRGIESLEYTKPEWCTVASANYGSHWKTYGGWAHKILINVPKVNGKPDFMSAFKVQCDNATGKGRWADIRDGGGKPYRVFKKDWTDGMYDFYLKRGFVTGPEDVCEKGVTKFDIENGHIISQSEGDSIVPKFKARVGSNEYRYGEIQQIGPFFIGRNKKSDDIVTPFNFLNPENGDPIGDDAYLKVNGSRKVNDEYFLTAVKEGGGRVLLRSDGKNVETVCEYQRMVTLNNSNNVYRDTVNQKSYMVSDYGLKEFTGDFQMFGSSYYFLSHENGTVEIKSMANDETIANLKSPSIKYLSFTKNGNPITYRFIEIDKETGFMSGNPAPIEKAKWTQLCQVVYRIAMQTKDPNFAFGEYKLH